MTRSRVLLVASFSFVALAAALALSVFVLGPARAAVGPLPAEALVLPAGTRVVSGFDVARFVSSPLYQRFKKAGAKDDPFKELRELAGLDPERDLERVVFAGTGQPGQGVVMAFGRFDRYALGRALETHKNVTWKSFAGSTLYLFDESKTGAAALAFLGDDVIVAGERRAVEETLTNRERGTTLRGNAALMGLLGRVTPGAAFWLVGDQTVLSKLPAAIPAPGAAPGSEAQLALPALQGVVLSAELQPLLALDVVVDAADAAAAGKLADVVRGLLALASLQAAQKPELQQLSSAVSVTTEAHHVRLALRLPYELLDTLGMGAHVQPEPAGGEPRKPTTPRQAPARKTPAIN